MSLADEVFVFLQSLGLQLEGVQLVLATTVSTEKTFNKLAVAELVPAQILAQRARSAGLHLDKSQLGWF